MALSTATLTKNPTTTTHYGRLSFPVFSYQEAVARNAKSQYPTDPSNVTPEFNILLEQHQLDKFLQFALGTFLPYCQAQSEAGEKRNALTAAEVKRLEKFLQAGAWDEQPPYVPIKPVPEKTLELAPESVAMLKVKGNRGVDIEQRAVVASEDELLVPDPNLLKYPVIKPIGQTVHQIYPGCYVAATLNLYAFLSGKTPGFSASASTVVFRADAERFGGGVAVDEDEIFAD